MRHYVLSAVVATSLTGVFAGGCYQTSTSDFGNPGPFGEPGPSPFDVAHPSFGATVSAAVKPPPISGGTLLMWHDGNRAIAADPDRDAVYVVDVQKGTVAFTIPLQPGDEPGRLVEDAAGNVHVALRGAGSLVTIDPVKGTVLGRRAACPAPRGVAYDATNDAVWVACATGELVSFPAGGAAATQAAVLERDLRDVLVQNGTLVVSEFRSARLLFVGVEATTANSVGVGRVLPIGAKAKVQSTAEMPLTDSTRAAHVAWRTIATQNGSLVVMHQEESSEPVQTQQPGGYGGGIDGTPSIVTSVVTVFPPGSPTSGYPTSLVLPDVVLPVDVAVSADGTLGAAVGAGNSFFPDATNVEIFLLDGSGTGVLTVGPQDAQATAVAFDGQGRLIVQTRDPAQLWVVPKPAVGSFVGAGHAISLSSTRRSDTGYDVFQTMAGAAIACASCHPEGGDDGHVWMLDGDARRTPSLRGTIAGTAPYHWPGDQPDMQSLVSDVYKTRMQGVELESGQLAALRGWVEAIPAPPAPSWVDANAAARGKGLFESAAVGCATCHSGAKFTNNLTLSVGTRGSFQVPPLVGVGWRTPLLHDGCAATLAERFGKCATPGHGSIGSLSSSDLSDLVAYLETL